MTTKIGKIDRSILKTKIEAILENREIGQSYVDSKTIDEIVEQLGIYHQELEFQNQELKRIQQELEISQNYFFSVFDEAPIGYIICDEDGIIKKANKEILKLLSLDLYDMVGASITKFIAPESQDDFYFHSKKLIELKNQDTVKLFLMGKEEKCNVKFVSNPFSEEDKMFIRIGIIEMNIIEGK